MNLEADGVLTIYEIDRDDGETPVIAQYEGVEFHLQYVRMKHTLESLESFLSRAWKRPRSGFEQAIINQIREVLNAKNQS